MRNSGENNEIGSFYGLGVGPGDPELLTIKAQRTLQRVAVICFTQLDDGQESYALSVVKGVLEAANPVFLAITIPHGASLILTHDWNGEIQGLNLFFGFYS